MIASKNGIRPRGVITYADGSADDLCEKLNIVARHYEEVKRKTKLEDVPDGIEQTADCLLDEVSKPGMRYELGLANVRE